MKKLLITLTVLFALNIALAMAGVSITIDGKPVELKEFDTGKNGTFLYKAELSTSAYPSSYLYKADKLQRGEITFQSQDYWFHDSILIEVEVDLEKGYKTDVGYYYGFDETIDMTKASKTNPLEISFLGEPYKITGVNSGTSFTVCNDCNLYSLDIEDSVEVSGKTITLSNVGYEGSVRVYVNGEAITISETANVQGLEITIHDAHWESDKWGRSATLMIGKPSSVYQNGNTFKDDWKWNINGLNEKKATELWVDKISGPYIGIKNNPSWKSLDSEECVSMPNDYPTICIPNLKDYFSKEKVPQEEENESFTGAEDSIYDFLDYIVEGGEGYVLVLGDKAPSSDSLAATDIISGIWKYSDGGTVLEAKLASEVTNEDKMILVGNPCDNPLIDLSCKNWPYKQGETLIKVDGDNLIIAGTTAEDTRSTAKIVANYRDYSFLKESDTVLVTKSGLEIPTIIAEPRQEDEETEEEEIVEEKTGEETVSKSPELTKEEPAIAAEKLVEEKGLFKRIIGGFGNLLKKIWCKVLHPFGNKRYTACLAG